MLKASRVEAPAVLGLAFAALRFFAGITSLPFGLRLFGFDLFSVGFRADDFSTAH